MEVLLCIIHLLSEYTWPSWLIGHSITSTVMLIALGTFQPLFYPIKGVCVNGVNLVQTNGTILFQ